MQDLFREKYKFLYIPIVLGSLVATVYLIQIVAGFLSQFDQVFIILFIAWIISIVLRPVVFSLHKRGFSYTSAAVITFIIFFIAIAAFLIYIIPLIGNELGDVKSILSSLNFSPAINQTLLQYNINLNDLKDPLINNPLQYIITFISNNSFSTIGAVLNALFVLALSFFFAFFLIQSGGLLNKSIIKLIPKDFQNDFVVVTKSFDVGLSSFIRGQVLISFVYSLFVMIVMKLLGLHFILISGIFSFVVFLVPLFGAGLALILPLIVALSNNLGAFAILAIFLILMQQILLNIVMPKVYSKDMGIHPAVVILSILIGFQLFGIIGLILALPVASVIQTLLSYYLFSSESK